MGSPLIIIKLTVITARRFGGWSKFGQTQPWGFTHSHSMPEHYDGLMGPTKQTNRVEKCVCKVEKISKELFGNMSTCASKAKKEVIQTIGVGWGKDKGFVPIVVESNIINKGLGKRMSMIRACMRVDPYSRKVAMQGPYIM